MYADLRKIKGSPGFAGQKVHHQAKFAMQIGSSNQCNFIILLSLVKLHSLPGSSSSCRWISKLVLFSSCASGPRCCAFQKRLLRQSSNDQSYQLLTQPHKWSRRLPTISFALHPIVTVAFKSYTSRQTVIPVRHTAIGPIQLFHPFCCLP